MTSSIDTHQAEVAHSVGHAHRRPRPSLGWWHYACPKCTPDLWQTVTTPEKGYSRSHAQCPWCLTRAAYKSGRFVQHPVDDTICVASGMRRAMASAMLEAAVNGRGIDMALQWASVTGPNDDAEEVAGETLIGHLAARARLLGVNNATLAKAAGFASPDAIAGWWLGHAKTPQLSNIIHVASALRLELVVRHDSLATSRPVDSVQTFFLVTRGMRTALGVSSAELASRLNRPQAAVRRRDTGVQNSVQLRSANAWCAAIGAWMVLRDA